MPQYSLALHTKAHIDTNFDDEQNRTYCTAYSVMYSMYLLYPTVHFQNLGRILQGLGHIFGYQNIVPFSFGDACIWFPFSLAASAQNVWVVTWEGEHILWNPNILNALSNIKFRLMNILPLAKFMLKEKSYTYNWRIIYWLGSKLWHRKFHPWHRCRLFWHQLRSHSAKSTSLALM